MPMPVEEEEGPKLINRKKLRVFPGCTGNTAVMCWRPQWLLWTKASEKVAFD